MRRCGLSQHPALGGAGLPDSAGSAGARGGPRQAREARLLRGVDEKVTGGWGLRRGGPPLLAVAARPAPSPSGAAGEAACALTAVVTHAVFRRGGSGGVPDRCCVDGTLCVQLEVSQGRGVCFSFPRR